jgi:molybdopterin biosynthesis enzyme MoaB
MLDLPLPGFGELVRAALATRDTSAALVRTGAGVAGRTLIVWLPSEPEALAEQVTLLAPAIKLAAARLRA